MHGLITSVNTNHVPIINFAVYILKVDCKKSTQKWHVLLHADVPQQKTAAWVINSVDPRATQFA